MANLRHCALLVVRKTLHDNGTAAGTKALVGHGLKFVGINVLSIQRTFDVLLRHIHRLGSGNRSFEFAVGGYGSFDVTDITWICSSKLNGRGNALCEFGIEIASLDVLICLVMLDRCPVRMPREEAHGNTLT